MADFDAILGEAARAAGLEPRHVFWRHRLDAAGTLTVEASDPELLLAGEGALRAAHGGDIRTVRLPADPALAGRTAWVVSSVAEVRRKLGHEAEQVTQLLQGECLAPFLHEGGWIAGQLSDGYVGWVRDWHVQLVPMETQRAFAARAGHRVAAAVGRLLAAPRADAKACGETVLGTPVVLHGSEPGWCEIELPGGRRGWLPASDLRSGKDPWPPRAAEVLATLERFIGVPYLWGGRSPKGFDCSGLVQFAFGLHGIPLPRDADQQAACGIAAPRPAPGDLLFFGETRITHVAVALDAERFLHARGEVRRNSLVPGSPLHDAELAALWRGTRRVLSPAA
jgi:cell wall-associated NlpC family hydrolase